MKLVVLRWPYKVGKLWQSDVLALGSEKPIFTVRGKSEFTVETKVLDYINAHKNWNLVSVSRRGRVEGAVGMHLNEVLKKGSDLPALLVLKLVGRKTLLNVRYRLEDCLWPDGRIGFMVSGRLPVGGRKKGKERHNSNT